MLEVRAIARALGGDVAGRNTVLAPGPGHSARDRSLSIKLDPNAPDGFLIFSHADDDWKSCRDYVRERLKLPAWEPGQDDRNRSIPPSRLDKWDLSAIEAEVAEGERTWTEDELLRIAAARRVWDEAKNPRGTLAEKYLREHRRLDLSDELAATVIRFHPHCPWRNEDTGTTERIPALIAAFRSIDNDAITGIQRVALNPDASKRGRRMLGIVWRAAIKLAPAKSELAIGEGLETTMAGQMLGFRPAWALGSVGAISFFPVIAGVQRLTILGEAGDASARAMRICGRRWRQANRRVRAAVPSGSNFSDLNDVLIARAAKHG